MFISLPFLTSLTFLLGLLSAVLIAAAFHHLATKQLSILLAFNLFCCFLAPWLLPSRRYCFSCLGCRAVLRFSPPFLILAAIFLPCHFQRCHPFYRCSASNIAAFHSRLDLELPFFALVLSSPYSFATKDVFIVTTSRRPVFFSFLVVVLLVIFTQSCRSYCYCSTR